MLQQSQSEPQFSSPVKKPQAGPKFIVKTNQVKMINRTNPPVASLKAPVDGPESPKSALMPSIKEEQHEKSRPPSTYIARIQAQTMKGVGANDDRLMSQTARDNPSQPIFPKGGTMPSESDSVNLVMPAQVNYQGLGASQSMASLPQKAIPTSARGHAKARPKEAGSNSALSVRPSTAATSRLLSQIQNSRTQQSTSHYGASTTPSAAAPAQSARGPVRGQSRQMRLEAQIAAENAKKRTVPQAPNFSSASRAKRRNVDLIMTPKPQSARKIFVDKGPVTPTLHTLARARQRAQIYNKAGETHRLDDPYSAAAKFAPLEKVVSKGAATHERSFSTCYSQKRSLSTNFIPSIVTMKGGNTITSDMFKPTINRPKTAKKDKDEESDCSDNTVVRAYKKQQAHVEALYWHEGATSNCAWRECVCEYGETKHYKRPKKMRYWSGRRTKAQKEIWARLTRPKSAVVVRKRD